MEHSIEAEGTHKLYGVDQQEGAMVLIRPDQIVAWKGSLDNVSGLEEMLLDFMRVDMNSFKPIATIFYLYCNYN